MALELSIAMINDDGGLDNMQLPSLLEQMHSHLERNGYRVRTVSTTRIKELQEEIDRIHSQGLFYEELYRSELAFFEFKTPVSLPEAKTLIIVAMPQPPLKVTFIFHGKPHQVLLPPTYKYSKDKKVQNILYEILGASGYNMVQPDSAERFRFRRSHVPILRVPHVSYSLPKLAWPGGSYRWCG